MARSTLDMGVAFRKMRAKLNAQLGKAPANGRLEGVIMRLERAACELAEQFDAELQARKERPPRRRPPSSRKPGKS
jgi:hypothetical protein